MNWQSVIGLISTIAILAPVVLILALKLYQHRNYQALLIYCLNAFIYNLLTEGIIPVHINISRGFSLYNNLLDVPLMMTVLHLFAKSVKQRKTMRLLTWTYIGYELIVLAVAYFKNINIITDIKALRNIIAIIIGPGIALVLFYSSVFFAHRIKIAVTYQKAFGKAIIISSILFVYACFTFVYIIHYVMQVNAVNDTFVLYYIIAVLFNTVLCVGLFIENKRIKKLQELLVTRKELSEIFPYTKPAVPNGETADSWKFN